MKTQIQEFERCDKEILLWVGGGDSFQTTLEVQTDKQNLATVVL